MRIFGDGVWFYLFTTDGLEDGTARNGDEYLPIMLTTGIEFAL